MKRWAALVATVAAATLSVPVSAQKSAMLGGLHDVRVAGNTGNLCAGCHTPHSANVAYKAVLWNRSYVPTAASFTSYDINTNPDFKGGSVSLGASSALSLLCMSCHDGTTAVSAVIRTPSGTTLKPTTVASTLGSDLSNDHPVGFSYDASITGQGTPAKLVQTPDATKVKLFGTAGARRVECGSCHDAHTNAAGFLRSPNTNSALCLACHL
ncbi:MAG TPA: cytochrome c3 family protein [Vicinamibacterales bacterium]|jgi:predicted CXXCH cytochrome family protein